MSVRNVNMGQSGSVSKLAVWVFGASMLTGCAQGDGDISDELNLGTATNPVQAAYVSSTETGTGKGVHLLTSSSQDRKGKSTGAIRPDAANGVWPDGTEGMCGVTFISGQYGITAAHCVDSGNLPNTGSSGTPFKVQQFNTTSLNMTKYANQAQVTIPAGYSDWPYYNRAQPFSSSGDGYSVTTWTCTVHSRCSYGSANCPSGAAGVDIAMIQCPTRQTVGTTNWVRVATADDQNTSDDNDSIEVRWFHEVLNLATSATNELYQPVGNYNHYYYYTPGNTSVNYHYRTAYGGPHQMLPLRSWRSASGSLYESLGQNPLDSDETRTNIPVCHGTSGSGAFRMPDDANGPRFVGPLVTASGGDKDGKLCANMNGTTSTSRYIRRTFTALFEALPEVQNDR